MTVNLSIRNVPEDVAQRLRARAKRNHRSLQGELMAMVEAAATEDVSSGGLSETSSGYRDETTKAKAPLRWPSEAARLVRNSRDIDGAFEDTPKGMQRVRRLSASEVLARAKAKNLRTPGRVVEMVRQMRDER